jgi:large conductance mechanosensitive channel
MPIQHPRIRGEDLAGFAEERVERSRKVLQEFREFAVKGNVVDMAVGIIIGGAFATIVKSLVDDIIMPPVGSLLHGIDFKEKFIVLREGLTRGAHYVTINQARQDGAITLNYGNFINNILTFLIVAFAVFMLVRTINRLRREEQATPASPTDKTCPLCAMTIPITARRCPQCTSSLEAEPAH